MTLMQSSVDANAVQKTRLIGRHNNWFVPGLYRNELKRTWSMGLLYAIILFFAVPVVNLMTFSNSTTYYEEYPDRVTSFLSEYFSTANIFITIYACLGGMMCAMVVAEYLFDRRKTNFVCSLPVKRQAYLLTKCASNLTWSVLAWIPAGVLMVLVAALTPLLRPHTGMIVGGLFEMVGAWLCLHLYFFGLTLLACCFCGTGVMGGCMLLMLGGYIPAAALSLIAFADMTFDRVWTNHYFSEDLFDVLSGVFRIFHYSMTEMGFWYYLGTAAIGIVFTAGAVFLTKIRKSENAGVPFAFARVRDIVKYLIVGLAGLLGGMLFWVMSSGAWSIFWMLFGIVCGAVLSWMLCNTIFYKTPKMMFTGKRAVCILTAAVMAFSLVCRFDILNLNSYVPSNVMTSSVEVHLDDGGVITLRDRALIRTYNAMLKNGYAMYDKYGPAAYWYSKDGKTLVTEDHLYLMSHSTVWKTRYLFPVAKTAYAMSNDWITFVQALTAQNNFADLYTESVFEELEREERRVAQTGNGDTAAYYVRYSPISGNNNYSDYTLLTDIRTILDTYREEMRSMGANAMQQRLVAILYVKFDDSYTKLPVFEEYTETQNVIKEKFGKQYYSVDESVEYDRTFLSAKVYRNGELIKTLDEDGYNALYDSGVLTEKGYQYYSTLTLYDYEYSVSVTYDVLETSTYYYDTADAETGETTTASDVYENRYTEENTHNFFLGRVPEEYR